MKDYKKEYILDVFDDSISYVVTHNVYLAASLGSLGYEVFIKVWKNLYFPVYKVEMKGNINEDLDSYYLGNLFINARTLTKNIETLTNIDSSPKFEKVDMEVGLLKEDSHENNIKNNDSDSLIFNEYEIMLDETIKEYRIE